MNCTRPIGISLVALAFSAVSALAQTPAQPATAKPVTAKPAVSADDANLTGLKRGVAEHVDGLAKLAQEAVDSVFSFGELGFQEVETSKYLTGVLEKNGFTITRGQSGIPTAWVASFGSGKPVIALGSDIDGIPQSSQKPGVAYKDADRRRRARPRRRPQHRHAAEHRGGHRGEAHHGAREAARHDHAVARRRRGTGGQQGLVRA